MRERIYKKIPKKEINRCGIKTQRLYESIRGTVKTNYLNEALKEINKLPQLNKKPILIRNKKGILIEIVGKKGQSTKYSIDYYKGVFYFDGNKLGKRKVNMAKAFYSDEVANKIKEEDQTSMSKIWSKIQLHSRS